jgi:dienelactone hydrolase
MMGFSQGGTVALYASLTQFQRMHGPMRVEFAAYLPSYPGCTVAYIDDEQVSDWPVRLFHGGADDWNPLAPCQANADRLRRAANDVRLTEYLGARHVFDRLDLPLVRSLPQDLSGGFFNAGPGRWAGRPAPMIRARRRETVL